MSSKSILLGLALAHIVAAQQYPIQFDGRIAVDATAASFDAATSLFNPKNVFEQNLTMSQVVQFPTVDASLFDTTTIAVEMTINDSLIFVPSATDIRIGFRPAELLAASNGTDPSTTGIKTLHFSIMKDTTRPPNISHEYHAIPGIRRLLNQSNCFEDGDELGTAGSIEPGYVDLVNTIQVLYSTDYFALSKFTGALPNNVSGQGQFHFVLLKKPTGHNLTNVMKEWFQESGTDEGIIFGGIFKEDSSAGCIILSPA